jgi:hypothetical protein
MQAYDPSQDFGGPPYAGDSEAEPMAESPVSDREGWQHGLVPVSDTAVDQGYDPEIRVDESGLEAEDLGSEDESGVEPETY